MRYLSQGLEPEARFNALVKLARLQSEDMIAALKDHLVIGLSDIRAAELNGIKRSNFHRALDVMNKQAELVEEIKQIDWSRSPIAMARLRDNN